MQDAREFDTLMRLYGKPAYIANDNGIEFTGRPIVTWASRNRVEWRYIDLGQPQQHSFIVSLRDELLNEELFDNLADPWGKLTVWR